MTVIGYIFGVVVAKRFSPAELTLFGVGMALSEIARSPAGAAFWHGLTGGAQ